METSAFRPKDKRVASRSSEESYAGPGLADSSLITLPITPSPPRPLAKRVRRTRGLSEDEPPQNDDDEIRNEEYRTGGPLLVNLPAITEAVPQDSPLVVAWISGLKAATIDLLRAHSIEWKELTINKRQDSHVPEETTAATAETIFIMATKRAGQDWRAVCRDIRSCCVAYDLHDTNVEIADARGLTVAESFGVDTSEPIYKAWPALKRKVIEILGLRRWLALELLRRGKGATAAENPTTIVITIDYSSQLNWTDVREQIVELLEVNDFAEVAVEIGRGSICRSAQKDTKFLSEDAYQMKARMGTSMGPSGNIKRAGTFGCYVRLQSSKNNIWHTFGLTCHHVMLPSSSNHQLQDLWDRHGIMPSEEASKLKLDMPSLLDHLDTMKTYKDVIQSRETEDHKSVRRRVQDPDDFVPLYQSKAFERDEKFIVERKTVVRTAENFFESGSEQLGSVFASSGLCLSRSSNASVDWALLEMNPTRASINYLPSTVEAPHFIKFHFSPESKTMNEVQKVLNPGMPVFMKGRSTGFTMGHCQEKCITTLQSWKKDDKMGLRQEFSEDYSVIGIKGFHEPGGFSFGQGGDSGSAVMDQYGLFVGMFFAGNDYTGTGYFTCAEDLFSDIKRATGAKEVEILPDSTEEE